MGSLSADDIVIVSACRTPIGSMNGALSPLSAPELGAVVIKEVLNRAHLDLAATGSTLEQVIMGQVLTAGCGQNPARHAALLAGVEASVPALTVNQVCGSGLRAVCLAVNELRAQHSDKLILAGGQECMSRAPLLLPSNLRVEGFRMGDLNLKDSLLLDGLQDDILNIPMGNTAENVAKKFGIIREEQDCFACHSQQKCKLAQESGAFKEEIVPVQVAQPRTRQIVTVSQDESPRPDTNVEKLGKLRPAFLAADAGGTVTAGNASSINDGAAAVLLARYATAVAHRMQDHVMARVVSWAQAGCDPALMGLGPVPAVTEVLRRANWTVDSVDLWEINEAFAAQSIAVVRELQLPEDRVNVTGGAIALGHPIGASGCRVLVTLLHNLKRLNKSRGVVSLCIGGGMGIAMCVERVAPL